MSSLGRKVKMTSFKGAWPVTFLSLFLFFLKVIYSFFCMKQPQTCVQLMHKYGPFLFAGSRPARQAAHHLVWVNHCTTVPNMSSCVTKFAPAKPWRTGLPLWGPLVYKCAPLKSGVCAVMSWSGDGCCCGAETTLPQLSV